MGRPTKLTLEASGRIVQAVKAGNSLEVAAAFATVHRSTLQRWLQRGDPEKSAKRDAPYREFRAEVEAARAEAEVRAVARVTQAAEKDWRAAAWFLERRCSQRWGRSPVEDSDNSKPLSVQPAVIELARGLGELRLQSLTDSQLEELERMVNAGAFADGNPSGAHGGCSLPQAIWSERFERRVPLADPDRIAVMNREFRRILARNEGRRPEAGESFAEGCSRVGQKFGLPPAPD